MTDFPAIKMLLEGADIADHGVVAAWAEYEQARQHRVALAELERLSPRNSQRAFIARQALVPVQADGGALSSEPGRGSAPVTQRAGEGSSDE